MTIFHSIKLLISGNCNDLVVVVVILAVCWYNICVTVVLFLKCDNLGNPYHLVFLQNDGSIEKFTEISFVVAVVYWFC